MLGCLFILFDGSINGGFVFSFIQELLIHFLLVQRPKVC